MITTMKQEKSSFQYHILCFQKKVKGNLDKQLRAINQKNVRAYFIRLIRHTLSYSIYYISSTKSMAQLPKLFSYNSIKYIYFD